MDRKEKKKTRRAVKNPGPSSWKKTLPKEAWIFQERKTQERLAMIKEDGETQL